MTENQIKIIEELIKERNYQKAETLLNKLLQVVPDDWQGKLLLGTCKLLQGDIEAAQKIHTEAEAHFESGADLTENEKTFWKKYKKVFMGCGCASLIIGGLTVVAAACFGKMIVGPSELVKTAYAGPEYYKMKKNPQHKVPDERPKDSMHK